MPKLALAGVQSSGSGNASRVWSPQQHDVFLAVEHRDGGNLMVEAVAGSGKTTTLVEACERMSGQVAFLAYNKRIAEEIKHRVRHLPNVTAGTFHSFGFAAWRKIAPQVKVDFEKIRDLQKQMNIPWEIRPFTGKLASLIAQSITTVDEIDGDWSGMVALHDLGDLIPESYDLDDAIEWAIALRKRATSIGEVKIDFDDMMYLPLALSAPFPQYDWVLIDEAQDTNEVRREMASRLVKPGGRVLAVGDPHQAIYGFTGADADSLARISSTFSCTQLPLTITYRCPKNVVAHAHRWVSHIEAHESAPMGSVTEMDEPTFERLGKNALDAGDVVLCRNTKPLVSLAYRLIRRGIGARVEGRDIGQGLLNLVKKWKKLDRIEELEHKLEDHLSSEMSRLIAAGYEAKAAALQDRIETLLVICEELQFDDPLSKLTVAIEGLFGDTEPGVAPRCVALSTVHKSKGREWDRVYLLGRNRYMPSRYATQEWQLEQENNLCYVAVTRAKRELIEVVIDA